MVDKNRKAIAELCENLKVAKSQQSELEKAAIRRARQAEYAQRRERIAREKLTKANSTRNNLGSKLAQLRSIRKVEKQAEQRRGLVGCGSVRSASVIEKLEKQLRLALEENEVLEADFVDVRGIINHFFFCGAHFKLLTFSLFVIVIEELRLAKRKHKHDADLIAALRRKVDDPDPTIDMGEAGEEYSFEGGVSVCSKVSCHGMHVFGNRSSSGCVF